MCLFGGCYVIATPLSLDHYHMRGQDKRSLGGLAANTSGRRTSSSYLLVLHLGVRAKAEQDNSHTGKMGWLDSGLKSSAVPTAADNAPDLSSLWNTHQPCCKSEQKSSGGVSPKSPGKSLVKDFVNFSRSLDTCSWQPIPSWDHTYMNIRTCVRVCVCVYTLIVREDFAKFFLSMLWKGQCKSSF